MDIYYTYYSYETNKGIDGLGYIGHRKLKNAPTPEQERYFGTQKSPKNREFKENKNKEKIILGVFNTLEEAIEHEVYLHEVWGVDKNPHFANQAKQTSAGFYYCASKEKHHRYGKNFIHTEETKEKIAKSMTGKNNPFYRKSHTPESISKMSNALKGILAGDKNPQYDRTKYNWHNYKLNITEYNLTGFEMLFKYPDLRAPNISMLKSGKQKSHKGWTLCGCGAGFLLNNIVAPE